MTASSEGTGKSAAKLRRLQKTADMYKRGVVPAIIATELGISMVILKSYLKQLAARGEITLPEKPQRRADDRLVQLLARAKKRGAPAEERNAALKEIATIFKERDEARQKRKKLDMQPATRSMLEVALEKLQR